MLKEILSGPPSLLVSRLGNEGVVFVRACNSLVHFRVDLLLSVFPARGVVRSQLY